MYHDRALEEEITALSIDYDKCGDVLNAQQHKYDLYDGKGHHQKTFLDKITNDVGKSEDILVFVGSNRQSIQDDDELAKQNKNGSCFDTYEKYCRKNNEKNNQSSWKFIPLLLPDVENKKLPGWAKENKIDCKRNMKFLVLHGERAELDRKVRSVQGQLDYIKKNYKNKEVKFYFYDDDSRNFILLGLKRYLKVPDNITLNLVRYDSVSNRLFSYYTI